MRYIIFIVFGLSLIYNVSAQQDTVYFAYNRKDYLEVAGEYLQKLYNQEKTTGIPVFSSTRIVDKYSFQDLAIISVPVFYLKNELYKCGDNLESLLFFTEDPLFQEVLIIPKETRKVIGKIDIFESYYDRYREIDSINGFSLHGYPIGSDTKEVEKKLPGYMKENPDVFIFMIKGLHGYWSVIEGEIMKLTNDLCGLKGKNGSSFVCRNYGQEYINDIIKDEFRTGRVYEKCLPCDPIKSKQPVKIKLE
jgi:hypothetical protein